MSYLSELPKKINETFLRYPITILWTLIGSLFIIYLIEVEADVYSDYYAEFLTLILGVSWLIAVQFLSETYSIKIKWLFKLIVLVLLGIYYFSLPEYSIDISPTVYIRWFVLLIAGHLFILFAPFLKSWNKLDYWNYLQQIIISIFRSAFFSFVLFLGIALAILAVDNLFDFSIDEKIYAQLFVFCVGAVNTFIYLSDFPKIIHGTDKLNYTKALDVFLKYILIPILTIYIAIVYAYFVKIIIEWELPNGWISYLITILSILGFIIHIIIEPVRENHNNIIIKKFYPLFYYLILPLLVLLGIAVYTRINEYNFTENRYFLMLISFWILGVCIYILYKKNKRLIIIPISLFILCVLSSFGPWSAFNVSVKSQVNELKEIIYEINKDRKKVISHQLASRFEDISRYLKKREMLYLIDNDLGFKTSYITYSYGAGDLILDSIYGKDVKYPDIENYGNSSNHFYYFRSYDNSDQIILDIAEYDYFIEIISLSKRKEGDYKLTHESNNFTLFKEDKELFSFDIDKSLIKSLNKYQSLQNVPQEDFTYTISNEVGDFKLMIKNIQFEKINNESIDISTLNTYIMIKYKENRQSLLNSK